MNFIRVFLLAVAFGNAQVENPAKWSFSTTKLNVKKGETVELIFKTELEKGWYMYSAGNFEMAPAALFNFEKNSTFELIGSIKPIGDKPKNDEYIGKYRYFVDHAEFRQKIKILAVKPIIKGTYEFSTCSSENGICLPPKEENFEFDQFDVKGEIVPEKNISVIKNNSYETISEIPKNDLKSDTVLANIPINEPLHNQKAIPTPQVSNSKHIQAESGESIIQFFFLAFISGLVALLTPCVFPMIPMTVTFFLNSGNSRKDGIFKAFIYGFSIVFIYTIIGTVVSKLAGPEAANFLSTHWLPNIFFFIVFLLFAFSFLGMFEITLPSWIINASDQRADKGGLLGIFFMAITLVLVSFSCTGPIVGTILVQSAGGDTLKPMIGMFGYSLAFAIPFTLFAIFPSWLSNLPKSGGWLNTVKVVLGFLELALAFKFLSLADQAYHWRILDREINIAIWIAIFSALTLYLFGKITLPHDDKLERLTVPRLITAMMVLSFVIYLIPGMFGAPLKGLSGYLPPLKNHDFDLSKMLYPQESKTVAVTALCDEPFYKDILQLPHGIQGYFDYTQAVNCAKISKKPIFIDFTGNGCVNCRKMEENVWSDPDVLNRLKKDFIVVALYVDDKTLLPENKWYTSTYDGKLKKSMGNQNADFQVTKFGNNAQPFCLVVDTNGNILSGPIAYNQDVKEFVNFLEKGSR